MQYSALKISYSVNRTFARPKYRIRHARKVQMWVLRIFLERGPKPDCPLCYRHSACPTEIIDNTFKEYFSQFNSLVVTVIMYTPSWQHITQFIALERKISIHTAKLIRP